MTLWIGWGDTMNDELPEIDVERLEELMWEYNRAALFGLQKSLREIENKVLEATVWKCLDEETGIVLTPDQYEKIFEAAGDEDEVRDHLYRALLEQL